MLRWAREAGRSAAAGGLRGAASPLPAARTSLRWAATPLPAARTMITIPVGKAPQVLLSAVAPHRQGSSKDIAAIIFENGASIAGTKKVHLEDHFAMLVSIYTPLAGTPPEALVIHLNSDEVTERLGFSVQATLLDAERAPAAAEGEGEQRRLKLRCPQRPGIVLGVTELLKDSGCKLSSVSADTFEVGNEVWFEIEATVDVPPSADPEAVYSALKFWTESKGTRAELIFDSWLNNVQSNV